MREILQAHRLGTGLSGILATLALAAGLQGCGGDDLECRGPFCVSPPQRPVPSAIAPGPGNNQEGSPGHELPESLAVLVTDSDGRSVPGVTVHFAVSSGGGQVVNDTAQSDNEGRAWVRWQLGDAVGTQTLAASATDGKNAPLDGSPLELTATAKQPEAASLVLRPGLPDSAQNGVPLSAQPVLDVLDGENRPLPGVQVVAAVASGGGSLTGGTTVTSDASGAATFTDLALIGPQGGQILQFTVVGTSVGATSGPIELRAGSPATLIGIDPISYEATVSSPVTPGPSVIVKDAAGNGVPGVQVTFTSNRNASVSPEVATTNEQGVAQVSWTLGTTANVQYTLTALIESSPIAPVRFTATARAGAAGRLRITVQPSSSTQSGTPFAQQPVIQVADANGNPTSQPGVVVTAAISSGPTGTLANATATTDAAGQAAFNGLSVTGVAGNYTLSFSAPGLAGATSSPFAITVGTAARLAFATKPSTAARSRAPLVIQPVLQIQDASGNPIRQAGVPVTVSALPSGTTVTGETVTTDPDGRAQFTALTLIGTPGPKDLTFSAPNLRSVAARVTLPSIATVATTPSHPVSAVVGTTVAGPVVSWTFRDAATRPVPDADFTLTAPSGGTAAPVNPVSDLNGVVQAGAWTLGPTAGYQYLQLRLPDGRIFQDSILAVADVASRLTKISGDNQSAPAGSELPELLVVRVVDKYGNGVGNVAVQWSTCDGVAGPTIPSDASGYSSTSQPTGSQPSGSEPFCTMASAPGLQDSPVQFHYTVTGTSAAIQTSTSPALRLTGPPPVAPR
jgi:adhesin/invasin